MGGFVAQSFRLADGQPHSFRAHSVAAQPHCDKFRKRVHHYGKVLFVRHITRGGSAVTDTFRCAFVIIKSDFFVFDPSCRVRNFVRDYAETVAQHPAVCGCQRAYGAYAQHFEFLCRRAAYHNQVGGRERAYFLHIMFAVEHDGGVGFFEVAAEFCKHFRERNPDGNRQPRTCLHRFAYSVRKLLSSAPEQPQRTRHVQPALVQPETLHSVRKLGVYAEDFLAVTDVFVVMRRDEDYAGTFFA